MASQEPCRDLVVPTGQDLGRRGQCEGQHGGIVGALGNRGGWDRLGLENQVDKAKRAWNWTGSFSWT